MGLIPPYNQEINAYSLVNFSRKGDPIAVAEGKALAANLKFGRTQFLDPYLSRCQKDYPDLAKLLDEETLLVPTPRSAPLVPNGVWPALAICTKLQEIGFGGGILPLLTRVKKVPKASFQDGADERPLVNVHYDSMSCKDYNSLVPVKKLVIVDDIITQGRTSAACFLRLRDKFPKAEIIVFTPVRTESFREIEVAFEPKHGLIKYFRTSHRTFTKFE